MLIMLDVLNWDLSDVPQHTIQKPPHKGSFGGSKNPGHYQQPSSTLSYDEDDFNFIDDDKIDDSLLPKSNVGDAIISVSRDNIQNANGHYLHDPIHGPFASPLYKQNSDAPIREAAKDYEEQCSKSFQSGGSGRRSTLGRGHARFFSVQSRIPSAEFPELLAANKDTSRTFLVGRSHRACQAKYLCRIWLRCFNMTGAGLGDAVQARRDIFSDCLRV
jgi:hypothetical protein